MTRPRMTEQELAEAHRRVRISRMQKARLGGKRSSTEGRASTPGAQGRLVTRREPVSSPVSSPSFIVHGVAMGKPRMTQQDKWKQRPAVMRYRAWCDLVRFAAGVQAPMVLTQGVRLSVIVYLPCPASWSQATREQRMGTPHVSKPDLDNLVKGLMDALFVNDSFVWMIEATKFWDNRLGPHVVVRIEE